MISDYTDEEDIGILVVDIDGNDYWIWKEINVIKPRIVVCEYNALFGKEKSLTIPYDPSFVNPDFAHYGVSLRALVDLADEKGYYFVGCNSAGNDAFFVRKDVFKAPLTKTTAEKAFVKPKFRGAYKNRKNEWEPSKPLYDLSAGKVIKPKEAKQASKKSTKRKS